jgi:cyclopropane fatty-acyl-phospholipid synthase-like methyltransferase
MTSCSADAQQSKKPHIAAKLLVEHVHRMLDIGSDGVDLRCTWPGIVVRASLA